MCEYNTSFCVWCILVLDRQVGSPLMMTCLRAVGRKLVLPPFLWNLSSSPVLSHPLFSHWDDCVLVMFQPPRRCFAVSSNHLLSCNCLALRFGLAGKLADCFCLAEGPICSLLVEFGALPIALASICLTIPCICCLLLFDLCFSVPATPALHFNFCCHTSKVGIFCASSLWLFFLACWWFHQSVSCREFSVCYLSLHLHNKMEENVIYVKCGGGVGVCALKCVLETIFLFHIHTCATFINIL